MMGIYIPLTFKLQATPNWTHGARDKSCFKWLNILQIVSKYCCNTIFLIINFAYDKKQSNPKYVSSSIVI